MTSDPAAPGAPAVCLLREEKVEDEAGKQTVHVRIKILTQAGLNQYSDVTIPYEMDEELAGGTDQWIKGVEARTIHSDGTVIPFAGKPWQKEIEESGGVRVMEKGFSFPDVQVGSILEYRWKRLYHLHFLPEWYIQQPIFVHQAHYSYLLYRGERPVGFNAVLPENISVSTSHDQDVFEVDLTNVPPLVEEEDSPPMENLGYRVLFFDRYTASPDDFWQLTGVNWGKDVDKFCAPNKLRDAVAQIVSPGDSDEQKLRKIYAAVMQLENTGFTRERTQAENKAQKLKLKTAADIWTAKRGSSDDLAFLFIAMARAAGVKAYAMILTDRNRTVFLKAQMDWDQLDDVIAIVNVNGREMYLDPGQPYCEFGKLHWKHTWTTGVRELDNGGAQLVTTPFPIYSETTTLRNADLTLDADGQVHGTITMMMTGNAALYWRQEVLLTDEDATKKEFSDELQKAVPPSVTLNMTGFSALTDLTQVLAAKLEVSGPIGTRTGHRLFVPGTFFEAQTKARFAPATRQNPVYLPYSYTMQDHVKLTLPDGVAVESPPTDASLSIAPNADFGAKYRIAGTAYQYARLERVANILYQTQDYPGLRDFFQKINAQDQEQLVLGATGAADGPTTPTKNN